MLKKIWHDPVWSKIIAAGILAVLTLIGARWSPLVSAFLTVNVAIPIWLLGLLGLIAVCAIVIGVALAHPRAQIELLGEVEPKYDQNPPGQQPRTYPLKVYRTLRNDSIRAIGVRIGKYTPPNVMLKKFVTDVLQVKIGNAWIPEKGGVERIAVLPTQQFRLWVGPDDAKFTESQLAGLKGTIGTVTLLIDERPFDVPL